MPIGRWDRCIVHYGDDVSVFVREYFEDAARRVLLFAAAGFDPRSGQASRLLAEATGKRLQAVFIREERPSPDPELVRRAIANLNHLKELVGDHRAEPIEIFASDGAVVGGRRAAELGASVELAGVTDVIVDVSALSKGVWFPLVRQLYDRVRAIQSGVSLHLLVADEPGTDAAIVGIGSDKVNNVHGFSGGWNLAANRRAAKLWLPQLIVGQKEILERIYSTISPHDVCPILPFPASHPRRGDELVEHYAEEFESVWNVDTRNIVYAMENRPLDLYRTIRRIAYARKPVFAGVQGIHHAFAHWKQGTIHRSTHGSDRRGLPSRAC